MDANPKVDPKKLKIRQKLQISDKEFDHLMRKSGKGVRPEWRLVSA